MGIDTDRVVDISQRGEDQHLGRDVLHSLHDHIYLKAEPLLGRVVRTVILNHSGVLVGLFLVHKRPLEQENVRFLVAHLIKKQV